VGTVKLGGRFVLALAALVIAVPSLGHAETKTYTPAWQIGPSNQGVDQQNSYMLDPATGQMTVLRVGASANIGGLGCAGRGPYASFEKVETTTGVIKSVKVHYDNALIDPYTFISFQAYQNGHFVGTREVRGPLLGAGDLTIDLSKHGNITSDITGPLTLWFGLNVPSACPNFDGGTLTFSSLTVEVA
jgi:hypothetical protein